MSCRENATAPIFCSVNGSSFLSVDLVGKRPKVVRGVGIVKIVIKGLTKYRTDRDKMASNSKRIKFLINERKEF